MTMEANGEIRELKKHIDWLSAQVTDRDEIIDRLDRIEREVSALLYRQGVLSDSFVRILQAFEQLIEQAQAMQAEMREAKKQTLYDCGKTFERIVSETKTKQTNKPRRGRAGSTKQTNKEERRC